MSAVPLPPSIAREARGRLQPPPQPVHQQGHRREPDEREHDDHRGQQQGPGQRRPPLGDELGQQAEEEHGRLRVEGVGQEALAQRAREPRPRPARVLLLGSGACAARGRPSPHRVQAAQPQVEHVRAAEQLDGAEQDGHRHEDGGESRGGQRGVHQQPSGDPYGGGEPGPPGYEGVAYDDGEVGTGEGHHSRGDGHEGEQLCVHGSTLAAQAL